MRDRAIRLPHEHRVATVHNGEPSDSSAHASRNRLILQNAGEHGVSRFRTGHDQAGNNAGIALAWSNQAARTSDSA